MALENQPQLGCFGSVLYHDSTSRRCEGCALLESCKVETESNRVILSNWYSALVQESKKPTAKRITARAASGVAEIVKVEPPKGFVKKPQPITVKVDGSDVLNKKPREFVEKWTAKGIDFTPSATINPFQNSGNKFAMVAYAYFAQCYNDSLEVSKDDLIDELVLKLKWGIGTASSHTNIIFEAFVFLKVIRLSNGKGVLNI